MSFGLHETLKVPLMEKTTVVVYKKKAEVGVAVGLE